MGNLMELITEATSKLNSFDGTNGDVLLWCCKNYQENKSSIDYLTIRLETTEGLLAAGFPIELLAFIEEPMKQALLREQANEF